LKKLLIGIAIAALAFTLIVSPCAAWGSIAHEYIAQRVLRQVTISNTTAFYAGCVLPDVALANSWGKTDARQAKFHTQSYLDNLKKYATTQELKDFVKGWTTHIVSDSVESAYSKVKRLSADWGVDKLLRSSNVNVAISNNIATLMVRAWIATYPTDTSVNVTWIKNSAGIFNLYLMGLYNPMNARDAQKFSIDYQIYLNQSVKLAVEAIKKLG